MKFHQWNKQELRVSFHKVQNSKFKVEVGHSININTAVTGHESIIANAILGTQWSVS